MIVTLETKTAQDILNALCDAGIVSDSNPDSVEHEDYPLPLKLSQFVASGSNLGEMNKRIWHLLEFVGRIASQLRQQDTSDLVDVDDYQIETCVAISAGYSSFTDAEIIRLVQSCLRYWNRTETVKSLGLRTSNIIEVIGIIGRVVNDPDRVE